jgi:serine/threonine protein kinase/Tfp pilus assembly protein PilF
MEIAPDNWDRAKQLFEAALELEPSERQNFLAQNCVDENLRQQVEQLLLNYQQAGSFLDNPVVDPRIPSPDASPRNPKPESGGGTSGSGDLSATATSTEMEDPMVGRHLGAYKLIRRLGQGGMAAVYLAARADDEFRKQAAVKIVQPGLDSQNLLKRFRNERQTLAGLDHPNIVKLLDGGSTPEGFPFLVMDYLEGCPIDDYCDLHKLCVDDRLRVFSKVCEAVQYAHRKGVVHRDLKPSNIFVTADGSPKLLDFGIAKVLNTDISSQILLSTQTGARCMTPAYASPEQIRGKPVTSATDIYSLGVMLYELLSGHRPYRLTQHTPAEMERAICEQYPETPSTAVNRVETDTTTDGVPITKTPELVSQTREGQPDKLRQRLRGDLDNIVLKALQKEPERRYSSVEEFSQDIEWHLQHLPVKARTSTLAYRGSKFVQRHRAESAAAIVMIILAAALAFNLVLFRHRDRALQSGSPRIQSLAVLPIANLSGDPAQEYFSEGMTDTLISQFSQVRSLKVISRTSSVRYKKTDKPLPQIAQELNVDGILEGTFQRSGDRIRIAVRLFHGPSDKELWSGSYERDLRDLFVLEREVTEEIAGQVQARLTKRNQGETRSVNLTALEAYLQGNYYLNKASGDQDAKKAQKYFQQAIDADPTFAPAYARMAMSHFKLLRSSVEDRALARASAEKAVALDGLSSDAHGVLGVMKVNEWDWTGGEQEFRHAIALNPSSSFHEGLCWLLDINGLFDEAFKECETAQALDPNNDHLYGILEDRGEYDRAIELLAKDVQSRPDNAVLHYFLFRDYAQIGKYKESVHELEQTTILIGHPEIAAGVNRAFAKSGYRGVLVEWARAFEELHATDQIYVPRVIAEVYAHLGDANRAFYWLEEGYKHRDRISQYGNIACIRADHELDSIRDDPRFRDLERRIGLPP